MIAGRVRLKRENGEVVSLTLDDLSEDDQAWVHKAPRRAAKGCDRRYARRQKPAKQGTSRFRGIAVDCLYWDGRR